MMKIFKLNLISLALLFVIINGCSQNKPNSCSDEKVKSQLISLAKQNTADINFVDESINSIQFHKQESKNLSCQVALNYSHRVFPKQNLLTYYRYLVLPDSSVKAFNYATSKDEVKYLEWLYSLPNIVGYQKTRYGIIAILQIPETGNNAIKNQIQQLSFDNSIITLAQEVNYSTITLDEKFTINTSDVFLISAYYNASKDGATDHNYFISIESAGRITVSPAFSYQDGSMRQAKDASLIFNGLRLHSYAESTDYPIYQYKDDKLSLLKANKPDSYYLNKFSTLVPAQILQQIKNEGCLNGDQFYSSDICRRRIKEYCFKFKAIPPKTKDTTYWLIEQMCKNQNMN